jgi:hypothetical protein
MRRRSDALPAENRIRGPMSCGDIANPSASLRRSSTEDTGLATDDVANRDRTGAKSRIAAAEGPWEVEPPLRCCNIGQQSGHPAQMYSARELDLGRIDIPNRISNNSRKVGKSIPISLEDGSPRDQGAQRCLDIDSTPRNGFSVLVHVANGQWR